ncbi:MAG: 2,3-bisphosphoglycerate-independent phosphoglycerate mutase [Kiloniellales bacterium]
MVKSQAPRPVVLCVLDGWGEAGPSAHNAIRLARTPVLARFYANVPHALIDASEHEVGLPAGQMGNSEVGHMNLGAGRVVLQDLPRIDRAVDEGRLAELPALQDMTAELKASGGTAHLLGLLSPGGVHSHQRHLAALANTIIAAGVPVAVHAFLDGRDTPPQSALGYLERFATEAPKATVATVSGRYYAMDRDKRWERTALAYGTLVSADGERAPSALAAVEQSYRKQVHDEFVLPTAIGDYRGMKDGDGIVMGNFRADRARQILAALLDPRFDGFRRSKQIAFVGALGLAAYGAELAPFLSALFPPQDLTRTLGEVVAERGLKQLRLAETEKYAHVTFFFNGGREKVFPGEERILVPSPKVATYDLKPEMSAPELTDRLVEAIESGRFDLIVVNYANGDMVGHTGKLEAAIVAVETVDRCLGRVAEAIERAGGALLITADHGNAEQMTDEVSKQPHTAHTMNKVPLILVGATGRAAKLSDGRLADIAPTLLALMKLPQPSEMAGRSLLSDAAGEAAAE